MKVKDPYMKLKEMSVEELVSNHERLCEMYFLRDDDIDEELRNSFSEIIFRITRGDKAIKAMEKILPIVNHKETFHSIGFMTYKIIEQYRREYEPHK